jgi:membrane carboxypeptidase/penicillin-binding protein PbpC
VGNSGHEPMHNVTGLTGAAPIWHEVMRGLLQGQPDQTFARPDGLTQVEVCEPSGLLPTATCQHTRTEWFITGTEPTQADSIYQQVWIDALTNSLADDSTPIERRKSLNVMNLPAQAQAWARSQGILLLSDYSQSSGIISQQENQLVLLSPRPNTVYRMDSDFDPSAQQLHIEVAAGTGISKVTIWMDGNLLATLSTPPYLAWWTLSPGEHRFWAEAVNEGGESVKSEIVDITVLD